MDDRESILANFQAITSIDDIAIAIYHLETSNWDLERAVHLAIPVDSEVENVSTFSSMVKMDESDNDLVPIQNMVSVTTINNIDEAGPSRATANTKINFDKPHDITFHVHFKNIIYKISISKMQSIDDLKRKIFQKTSIPVSRQQLQGWSPAAQRDVQNGATILANMDLSRDNNIFLTDLNELDGDNDVIFVSSDQAPLSYQLNIHLTNENRTLSLNFPSTKTVLEIKTDIYAVTRIPVRHQIWTGWPEQSSNSKKLSETGISPVHRLELTSAESGASNRNAIVTHDIDSDSEVDEEFFEDATEDIFSETATQNGLRHLIEDHVDDEIIGCLQFIENYRERYGHGPSFFEGSLEDAVKTACTKLAKDRKLLAIYLHHDRSVLSNVFCQQLLNNENMVKQLSENYIIYGWDLTCESNKNMFLSSLTACIGDTASLQIRNTPVNQLPAIMIIRKQRSSCEVSDIIHGSIATDELYIHLMMNSDTYNEQLKVEIREENERTARELVKTEQDLAYRESLEADRAKEEAKQQKEHMVATERRRLESERAESEAKRESIRREAELALPTEPDANCLDPVTKIRFRKPTGEFIERLFTLETKLKSLINYATANGFPIDEYKIISSFPRRDLSQVDADQTLKSLKFHPQETVMLEER